MFLGMLFLFLDFFLPLNGFPPLKGGIDLLPDAIGWWLIYAEVQDIISDYPMSRTVRENASLMYGSMIFAIVVEIARIFGGGLIFQILGLLVNIGALVLAWMWVMMLEELEEEHGIPANASCIRRATWLLLAASPFFLLRGLYGWDYPGISLAVFLFYVGVLIHYLYELYHWDKMA